MWYVIINSERRALAVYGSALLSEANIQLNNLRQIYQGALLNLIQYKSMRRPQVGQVV
jgi:hypothetical protein